MTMTKANYKEYRKIFIGLSDDDYLRVVAPQDKEAHELQEKILCKMVNIERENGVPGKWLHIYKGDYALYKPLFMLGEYNKKWFWA